ncbi:cell division protein FtsX [Acuticoccus mangrovi]|uniref:ABC transporter permease n=1 Tax=Acuticoccus mangrovi TaxID=2796142 RepID=A0A934INL3_9HYPH|nr:ABC transporter permease [Acuticoccus mangrovi]MBJ3777182.1 ABC transporter permease [Acuticoccus mangrovi]
MPEPRRDAADAWRAPPVEAPEDGDGAARRTLEAAPIRDETATPDREHHRSGRARPVIDAPDERTVVEGGPIVSPDTVSGRSMMAVIAIMTFLCSLLLGASLLIERAAGAWSSTVLEEVSVTVLPLDGEPIERRLQEVATLLEGAGGLADVEVVPEAQSEALLEPWLGSGVDLSVLPVPRLVVARRTGAIDTEFLTNAVASVPGASLDDHSAWSERLSGMASAVAFGAVAGLALIAVATAISVVFATRATIASNAATVEVLHLLGAEDRFVLRAFRRRFVVIGAKGALAGCVAALALFGLLDLWQLVSPGAHSPQAEALFGNPSIGPMGYIGLLAVAVGIIVLVAVTASLAVRHHLDRFIR